MNWLLKILVAHKRMKGLSENQLLDLIKQADDVESLKIIKQHLEQGDFKYQLIERRAPELIQQCIDKAREIQWQQHAPELKQAFLSKLVDPFVEYIDNLF